MSALQELVEYVSTADHWSGKNGITHRVFDHVKISATAVVFAAAVAIPPALWLGHVRRGGVVATAVVNIGRAVPSFAILALVFPLSLRYGFRLGFVPTLVALVALAIPPMFTNAYAGIVGVDVAVVDAARGMGMRGGDVLRKVEMPNALPLILTGVRVSSVQVVATATLGAYVGFGGLGAFINEGFRRQDDGRLLTGAVFVAMLAIAVELAFGVVQRRLTPWLTRKGAR